MDGIEADGQGWDIDPIIDNVRNCVRAGAHSVEEVVRQTGLAESTSIRVLMLLAARRELRIIGHHFTAVD